jgi:GNAT superfamily N-acetyltransferase
LRRIYRSTNGVIATVDAQWRNSPNCPKGTKKIPNLPSHLHIKNMEVHYKQRSKGIGKALLELIEDYARQSTDAEMLTLYVQQTKCIHLLLGRRGFYCCFFLFT